ncbi:hypothetical protein C2G38_2165907 [Gigaspora rosea]|uniref:Uncharacterized protein n=1 Tax=Gigaspora rosea TaxID=44941 RepID=A0A397VWV2_9GLOM|nr:hypothetical protein C2G38_2165907 [Gigaspora rosea]
MVNNILKNYLELLNVKEDYDSVINTVGKENLEALFTFELMIIVYKLILEELIKSNAYWLCLHFV